jgi:hypothetical protein
MQDLRSVEIIFAQTRRREIFDKKVIHRCSLRNIAFSAYEGTVNPNDGITVSRPSSASKKARI